MSKVKYSPSLIDILALAGLLNLAYLKETPADDPGLGWHIKTGELIWKTQSLPQAEPFLAKATSEQWLVNQWLSDIALALAHQIGGMAFLHAGLLFIFALSFSIIAKTLDENCPKMRLAALGAFLFITAIVLMQWFIRPVVLSFCFFSTLLYLLHKGGKGVLLIFPIFILWANCHPGYFVGFLLIGIFILSEILQKRFPLNYILILCFSILSTLINPYGIALWKNALSLSSDSYFSNLNVEWLSPNFHSSFFYPLLIISSYFVFSLARGKLKDLDTLDILLIAVFLPLSLHTRRYAPFSAIACALPLAKLLALDLNIYFSTRKSTISSAIKRINNRENNKPLFLYTSAFSIFLLFFSLSFKTLPFVTTTHSDFSDSFPKEAVNWLQENNLTGPTFHTPNWGGYLVYRGFSKTQLFIDDRNLQNTKARYEEFFAVNRAKRNWRSILKKNNIEILLLENDSPLRNLLLENNNEQNKILLVYQDKTASIFKLKSDSG